MRFERITEEKGIAHRIFQKENRWAIPFDAIGGEMATLRGGETCQAASDAEKRAWSGRYSAFPHLSGNESA